MIHAYIQELTLMVQTLQVVAARFSPRMVWMRRIIRWWCSLQPTMQRASGFAADGWLGNGDTMGINLVDYSYLMYEYECLSMYVCIYIIYFYRIVIIMVISLER